MHLILAILAYALLSGFLVILVIHVPRADLIGLIAVTLLLAAWDLVRNLREHRD